ncbi:MAG: T9SS type A sorting domain-containing protein [Bacteroidetes bacterium]|nr:T9SS type A sorting domain-containing protein [Bacteroidota bacterium]
MKNKIRLSTNPSGKDNVHFLKNKNEAAPFSNIVLRLKFSLLFIFIFCNGSPEIFGQALPGSGLWTGPMGIKLTVDQLMSQENPDKVIHFREGREHETRLKKKDNPEAPQVSSSSIENTSQERNGNGSGNSINATQSIGTSFLAAASNVSGFIPPDCNGAVGPTQILTAANGRIRVYNKAGVMGALNMTMDAFFSTVRNSSTVSDPHVRYDRLSQRWFVAAINVASTNNRVVLAVSSGPTITGSASFTFFYFQFNVVSPAGDNGKFLDYPTLGVDANALYIGGVRFNGSTFDGCPVFVVNKSSVLGAGPLLAAAFRTAGGTGTGIFVPQGVDNDDPAATAGYFIGTDAGVYSKLNIIRVNTPGATPTLTNLTAITVPTNNAPIRQLHMGAAANRRLDGMDDRLFAAHIMKNKITGVNTLVTSHTTKVNSSGVASGTMDRNASRWYEIGSLTTATPVLVQSGTLFDNAASNPRGFWNSAIAKSGQGHMVLGASTAGASARADVAIAGRYSSDAGGTLQGFQAATNSSTNYNVQAVDGQRWGDYSQTVVDPNDNMTLWTFQEYCDASNSWGMRVVQLIAPAPPPTASLTALPVVGNGPSVSLPIVATSTPNNSGFFDPGADAGGPGYLNRLSASVTGGIVVNSISFTDPTHLALDLNTTGVPWGTYTITFTNPDGQTTTLPITIGSPLPIELMTFAAHAVEKGCELEWVTATEINNDFFTLERSQDGKSFEEIGKVKGAGNSSQILNYNFTDEHPNSGVSYYRLKQTDYDGQYAYSDLVPFMSGKTSFEFANIVANSKEQTLSVYLNNGRDEIVNYSLNDALGKVVYSGSHPAQKGISILHLDGSILQSGIYYITVSNRQSSISRKLYY